MLPSEPDDRLTAPRRSAAARELEPAIGARTPPAVEVEIAIDHPVDVHAWARAYVRFLLQLEGEQASDSPGSGRERSAC